MLRRLAALGVRAQGVQCEGRPGIMANKRKCSGTQEAKMLHAMASRKGGERVRKRLMVRPVGPNNFPSMV